MLNETQKQFRFTPVGAVRRFSTDVDCSHFQCAVILTGRGRCG